MPGAVFGQMITISLTLYFGNMVIICPSTGPRGSDPRGRRLWIGKTGAYIPLIDNDALPALIPN